MTNDNFKGGLTHGELPINIDGMEVYDVSSLYPVIPNGKYHGKTFKVADGKMKNTLSHLQSERQKILDEVLKKLDKEIELVNKHGFGQIYLGLQHAKMIVKDMK
jgi:hypothetical protein